MHHDPLKPSGRRAQASLLRTIRKRCSISSAIAAEAGGITIQHLSRVERLERFPSVPVLHALLRLYRASPAEQAKVLAEFANVDPAAVAA